LLRALPVAVLVAGLLSALPARPAATPRAEPAPASAAPRSAQLLVTSPSAPARRLHRVSGRATTAPADVVVDPGDVRQEWWGTGAALTDASRLLLRHRPGLLDRLFSPTSARGARLSMLRLPLSSTDFSPHAWTWSAHGRVPAQERQAARLVRAVRDRQPDLRVVGANWTAPPGMKSTGRVQGGGLADPTAYGDLLVRQARWLKAHGVPLWATTLGNEPGWSTDYPSMTMDDGQMAALATDLGPRLSRLGTQLWALDHNWSDRGRVDALLAGSPAFSAAAFHCYGGDPAQMAGLAVPRMVTECTGTTDSWGSTFAWDARTLVTDAVAAGSSGLMMWNLALDATHGPRGPHGCQDCRGLLRVTRHGTSAGPEFYTLAHLARAASPGAHVVGVTAPPGVVVAAFRNPDGTIGVFGHNGTGAAVPLRMPGPHGEVGEYVVRAGELFSYRAPA
jgi:glucosylceramidase